MSARVNVWQNHSSLFRLFVFVIAFISAACSARSPIGEDAGVPIPSDTNDRSNAVIGSEERADSISAQNEDTDSAQNVDAGRRGYSESPGTVEGDTLKIPAEFCVPKLFPQQTCEGDPGYWGEALQKALWFFNVNKSGEGIDCSYVQWRGDAHLSDMHIKLDPSDPNGVDMSSEFIQANRAVLDPDGDGEVDLGGGYYDAGDYIKFAMTTGFSASTIAWSMLEFPESFRATGLEPEALEILRWFGDYLIRSTFLNQQGELVAFADQVGDITDHTCGWMPPEVRLPELCPRKGYFTTTEKPAADVTASAAAALAMIGLVNQSNDAEYARKCLDYATALYDFAATYPDTTAIDDGGLYTSEYAYDDLAWAAIWLYESTGEVHYLDDTLQAGGWLEGFPGFRMDCMQWDTICWSESWVHCWNSVRAGVFYKLAQILNTSTDATGYGKYAAGFRAIARDNVMRGPDQRTAMTPGGFTTIAGWGSGRYNSAAQFVSLLYAKTFREQDPSAADAITAWAQQQIDYLLGDNPLGKSYMMGFTDTYALQPHHPAGHGSMTGQPDDPPENLHIIWGALVNGPSDGDNHVDRRSDYGANEVTIDYNASFLAAIAAHYHLRGQGQCPLPDFPPIEPPADEFYTRSKINSRGNPCRSQVETTLINHSIHPPRYDEHLSFRYYFDISELQDRGQSIDNIEASLIYDNGTNYDEPSTLSGPHPCALNPSTYYYEIGFDGYKFWGELVQLHAPRTVIIDIGADNNPQCVWEPNNDWSYSDIDDDQPQKSKHLPVYSQGELIWGEEPLCHEKIKKEIIPPVPII